MTRALAPLLVLSLGAGCSGSIGQEHIDAANSSGRDARVVAGDAGTPAPDDGGAPGAADARAAADDATVALEDARPSEDAASPSPDAAAPVDAATPDAAGPADAGAALAHPLFVGVGYGTRRAISRDGRTWTNDVVVDPNGGDDNNLLRGAAWGDGRFVAVGGGGQGRSHVSLDGVTWTHEQTGLRAFLSDAEFGNGVWVAAGGNGYRVRSLDHGASWVDDTGYYAGHFRSITFGRGVFVAVGHTYGARTVMLVGITADGRQWTTTEYPGQGELWDVAFGNGVFVAVGRDRAVTSPDGMTWTPISGVGGEVFSVSFANGEHLISTRAGLWRSVDGAQWSQVAGFNPANVAHAVGTYVGTTWRSQRWVTGDVAQPWMRAGTDDGPAFTEIVVGDVP